jgi:hypothetical protein
MNGNLAQFVQSDPAAPRPHPNEVDRRRIERALGKRKRYRYVTPEVRPIADGYEIVSPCCSRNIDPDGGVIDIARLEFQAHSKRWMLYCKDHEIDHWIRYGEFLALHQILEFLNEDPDRRFWQ